MEVITAYVTDFSENITQNIQHGSLLYQKEVDGLNFL